MILETMREGVVLVALDGRYSQPPGLRRLFGRKAEGLIGSRYWSCSHEAGSAPATVLKACSNRWPGGKRTCCFAGATAAISPEKCVREIELSGEKRISFVVQDVSERKQLDPDHRKSPSENGGAWGPICMMALGQELTGISLMCRPRKARRPRGIRGGSGARRDHRPVNHAIRARAQDGARHFAGDVGTRRIVARLAYSHRMVPSIATAVDVRLSRPSGLRCSSANPPRPISTDRTGGHHKRRQARRARSIAVTARTNRARLSLSITDDGVGIPENPARGAGMGLKAHEYRCAVIRES